MLLPQDDAEHIRTWEAGATTLTRILYRMLTVTWYTNLGAVIEENLINDGPQHETLQARSIS